MSTEQLPHITEVPPVAATTPLGAVRGGGGPAGSAVVRGLRGVSADATAVHGSGASLVAAVADGIGDSPEAARAARLAADTAARSTAGPLAAVLAARDAVRGTGIPLQRIGEGGVGDAVLVVAAAQPGGWGVAWVGDCRALLVTAHDTVLLTHDHTVAQYFRDRGAPAPAAWENVVTTTVSRAEPGIVGIARGPAGTGTLVLLSDGVHRTLDARTIGFLVRRAASPAVAARDLVDTALALGSTDNATATVLPLPPEWLP